MREEPQTVRMEKRSWTSSNAKVKYSVSEVFKAKKSNEMPICPCLSPLPESIIESITVHQPSDHTALVFVSVIFVWHFVTLTEKRAGSLCGCVNRELFAPVPRVTEY